MVDSGRGRMQPVILAAGIKNTGSFLGENRNWRRNPAPKTGTFLASLLQ
jgi:hypothetical protein